MVWNGQVPALASKCIKTAGMKMHGLFDEAVCVAGGNGGSPRRLAAGGFHCGGWLSFMRFIETSGNM